MGGDLGVAAIQAPDHAGSSRRTQFLHLLQRQKRDTGERDRGYKAAKQRADQIRKQQGLPLNVMKFKAERRAQNTSGQFGVSASGKTFTNAYGRRGQFDHAPRDNPSKWRRFQGYTNYSEIIMMLTKQAIDLFE